VLLTQLLAKDTDKIFQGLSFKLDLRFFLCVNKKVKLFTFIQYQMPDGSHHNILYLSFIF